MNMGKVDQDADDRIHGALLFANDDIADRASLLTVASADCKWQTGILGRRFLFRSC
jgi:hypothetical protein